MQTVDLTCMQIVNMRTGTGKRIRRTPELDLLTSYDIHRTSSRFLYFGTFFREAHVAMSRCYVYDFNDYGTICILRLNLTSIFMQFFDYM